MITPASIGDWAMFAGLVGGFGGFAVIASRWIHNEPEIVWRTDRRESLVGQRAP